MMCSKILKVDHKASRFETYIEHFFINLSSFYQKVLRWVLTKRLWVLAMTGFIIVTMIGLLKYTDRELAPVEDQGFIFFNTQSPKYTNIDYLNAYSEQISTIVNTYPEKDHSFLINGFGGESIGSGFIILKHWEDRKRSAQELKTALQKDLTHVSGLGIYIFQVPPLPTGTGGAAVQFVISGVVDSKLLYGYANTMMSEIQSSGLFTTINSNLDFNDVLLKFDIDHSKANLLGVKMSDIGNSLSLFTGGSYVNQFNLQGNNCQVITQVPRDFRFDESLLHNFYLNTNNKTMTPMANIIKASYIIGPNQLFQFNQMNSVILSGELAPQISMGQAIDFLESTSKKILPSNLFYDFLSESRQFIQEGNSLIITFLFALIIIYLVLAAQFESYRYPFIIMLSVPLSLFGALIFLFFGYATLNIYTQIGLITLIGLITKHGILIVEFANQVQKERGLDKVEAIIEAATIRLRPILMTTSAMVAGLFPLLVASGAGSASRFSLGLVIITGMTIGTFFTLFVVPTFYTFIASSIVRQKD